MMQLSYFSIKDINTRSITVLKNPTHCSDRRQVWTDIFNDDPQPSFAYDSKKEAIEQFVESLQGVTQISTTVQTPFCDQRFKRLQHTYRKYSRKKYEKKDILYTAWTKIVVDLVYSSTLYSIYNLMKKDKGHYTFKFKFKKLAKLETG